MDNIVDQLKRIEASDSGTPRKSVTVLGAGMAGLSAAFELNRLGHTVKVIEASNRIGGRCWTHRFSSGQYHELGAMRIPASHDYTRHYVQVAGLQQNLRRFVTAHKQLNCYYHLRGRVDRIKNARRKVLPAYRLSGAEWNLARTAVAPAIFGEMLEAVINSLSAEDRAALFAEGQLSNRAKQIDALSLGEFIDNHAVGDDTKELIGSTTGLEVWWDKALSMFVRDELIGTGLGLEEIAGGMDQLPNELANKIGQDKIRLGTEVTAIKRAESGATLELTSADGREFRESADVVICTIPFGVLRRMSLSGLSSLKMRAIRNLNYASATKVLLHCSQRFWEQGNPKDRIVGGASFSDGIARATYYPSDNAPPVADGFAAHQPPQYGGLYTSFAQPGESPVPTDGFAASPGVLVGSYNWGLDARRLGALSDAERGEAVMDVIENFHPEIRRYVDEAPATIFWDSYRWSRGAFCFMRPGDLTNYYYGAIHPEGQIHFAGEHCSMDQGWIQGAVMSGLRTVEEIVG